MQETHFGHATHTGWWREHNEDSYLAAPDVGLWIVADGLGGHADGQIASAVVVAHVAERLRAGLSLPEALSSSHAAVLEAVGHGRGRTGMASTAVALHIQDAVYQVAWIGDSRAYLWDSRHLTRLTRDHSFVQQLLDSGALRPEAARGHPYRNILTRCIGSSDATSVFADTAGGDMHANDRILLCSDGLTGELSDAEIAEVFAAGLGAQETADRLVRRALGHGGSDNVTVLVVDAPGAGPRVATE
jgi:serine/threonine protein phosphatase PrpC